MTHYYDDAYDRQISFLNDRYGRGSNITAISGNKSEEIKFDWGNLPGKVLSHSPICSTGATRIIARGDILVNDILFDYLSIATPSRKEGGVIAVVKKYIPEAIVDSDNNVHVIVGADTFPSTMFSCHTDTVHDKTKQIRLSATIGESEEHKGFIFGAEKRKNSAVWQESVLGADDRLGMYIMTRMIQANMPGLYVFHSKEEMGGRGSEAFVDKHKTGLLKNVKRCIAFDRAGYTDVITHQRNRTRFASDDFGKAVMAALNPHLPPLRQFALCDGGSFTDSANYGSFVSECINLSVGYFQQHGRTEHFDAYWLEDHLLPAILATDWLSLPTSRDPAAVPVTVGSHYSGHHNRAVYSSPHGGGHIGYKTTGITGGVCHINTWTSFKDLPDVELETTYTDETTKEFRTQAICRSIMLGAIPVAALVGEYLDVISRVKINDGIAADLEATNERLEAKHKAATDRIAELVRTIDKIKALLPQNVVDDMFPENGKTYALVETVKDVDAVASRLVMLCNKFNSAAMAAGISRGLTVAHIYAELDKVTQCILELDSLLTTVQLDGVSYAANKSICAGANYALRKIVDAAPALSRYTNLIQSGGEFGPPKDSDKPTGTELLSIQ